jgi:hypothetical protein
MEKEFVPYEIALELKELEFDEPCFGYYDATNLEEYTYTALHEVKNSDFIFGMTAPLKQQAFQWFREKYDLDCYIESKYLTTGERCYDYTILIDDGEESDDGRRWRTFEEAELKCLKGLIDIVKKK